MMKKRVRGGGGGVSSGKEGNRDMGVGVGVSC